jgi:hypothetical protein
MIGCTLMLAVSTRVARHKRLAWSLCCLGLAGAGTCVVLDVLDRARIHGFGDAEPIGIVLPVSFSVLGAVIVSHRPENRIGWVYLLIGVLMPLQSVANLYYTRTVISGGLPGARWAAWLSNWSSLLIFPTGLALFSFLLFPGGRLPSQRSRIVAMLALGIAAVLIVANALDPAPISIAGDLPRVANPLGVSGLGLGAVSGNGYLLGLALIAVTIGSLVVRGRRAEPRERQQVKLLAYAAALTIGLLLIVTIVSLAGVAVPSAGWEVPIVFGFGIAVPVACGFAILRHGLFEIDRLISRTIAYTIVTGILVGVFLATVLLATRVLPFSSPIGVAVSTLAAAGLFNPLRLRVQRIVDRRFNRARYNAEETVAAFTEQARNAVDLDTLSTELVQVVEQAIAPAHLSLWLRSPHSEP